MKTARPFPAALLLAALPAAFVQPALAQSCTGPADFSGYYMFVGSRQLFSTPLPPPDRITNIEPTFSNTPIGHLLRGALSTAPFAVAGRLIVDGQGGIFAAPAEVVFITIRVGTYSVTTDCTLNITLTDGFLPIDLIAPPTPGTAKFTGVLQSRGGESNLVQVSGGDGTFLSLSRAHQAGSCSNATFTGPYGLAARGVELESDPEAKTVAVKLAASFAGRIVSDGNGNLFPQEGTGGAPLQMTGTYTLLADCTGSAKLNDGKTTRTINFVLTQANTAQNATANGVTFSRPVMHFVLADPNTAVVGVGREATGRL